MGSYDEMKSQGSFTEATRPRTKSEHATHHLAAAKRSEDRFYAAMDRVRQAFPEATDDWVPILAISMQAVERAGEKPTRENVRARAESQGYPVAELDELEEAA